MNKLLSTTWILLFAVRVLAGAWGAGSFENDDALGWAKEFEEKPTMALVVASLKRVTGDGYIEAPEAAAAIAAAEVVAAAAGKPSPTLPTGPTHLRGHNAALVLALSASSILFLLSAFEHTETPPAA